MRLVFLISVLLVFIIPYRLNSTVHGDISQKTKSIPRHLELLKERSQQNLIFDDPALGSSPMYDEKH